MNRKNQQNKQSLTPMQKQALWVCGLCAVAVLLTAGITLTKLAQGKEQPPASSEPAPPEQPLPPGEEDLSNHYQIDNTSAALLTETPDAGEEYLSQTLFLGDSNTVRLYNNGLISLQQFCAKEGIGLHSALQEGIVSFKNNDNRYTIPQAVAMMKPRRVVLTLGTNDTGMAVQDFINNYTALVQAIQASYPYTDIIVNTVPPVPVDHANYPQIEQTKIDDFNMALLTMCEQLGVKFLNSAEALKDEAGYGRAEYYGAGDIHLKNSGLKAMLHYLRTHAYQTEDRRPDTSGIPIRTLEYTSNPSSAVPDSSSEAASSEAEPKEFEARYQVDKNGGGTLASGDVSGKSALSYAITAPTQSVSVTAVPDAGYVFVKWSDGVTKPTRTDTNFKQNLDVTAVFSAVSVQISSDGKGFLGTSYTFKATLKGKYAKAEDLHWYANGQEVVEAAGRTKVTVLVNSEMLNSTYQIYAVLQYNGSSVASNPLVISVGGVEPGSSSSSSESSSSSSSSGSSAESSSSSSTESSSSSASSGGASSESSSSSESASSSESSSGSGSQSASSGSSSSSAESGSGSTDADSSSSGSSSSGSSSGSGSTSSSGSSSVNSSSSASSSASEPSGSSSNSSSSESAKEESSSQAKPEPEKEEDSENDAPSQEQSASAEAAGQA